MKREKKSPSGPKRPIFWKIRGGKSPPKVEKQEKKSPPNVARKKKITSEPNFLAPPPPGNLMVRPLEGAPEELFGTVTKTSQRECKLSLFLKHIHWYLLTHNNIRNWPNLISHIKVYF